MVIEEEKPASILIADDNPGNLRVLESMLSRSGYDVRIAINGLDALASIAEELPDMVLLDIHMPEMDGYETCRRIKGQESTKDIPVIFVSAINEEFNKVIGFQVGAVDYLTKPVSLEELQARLSTHLHLARQQRLLQAHSHALEESRDEARRAKERLESSEERLRAIVDNMADAVITINHLGIVQDFSKAAEKVFGYASSEVIGHNVSMLMPEEMADNHDEYLRRYQQTGEAHVIGTGRTVVARQKNGAKFPAELSITEISIENKKIFSGLLRDITERIQIESALQQARIDAEAASEAKSRFLATISHEIRTPMNGVVGMLELLQQADLAKEERYLASVAKNSALALLQIINDILDFSKIEAGKMTVEHMPYRWPSVIEGVAELLAEQVRSKKLQLFCFVDHAITAPLIGDPVRLRQIVLNLLGNAIKFTSTTEEKQGVIILSVKPLAQVKGEKPLFRLSIQDNGIGIKEEHKQKLFKVFSQADTSIHRQFGGTGLGLSICARLVEMMDGHIGCKSEEGVGSEFFVDLPSLPADEQEGMESLTDLHGLSVLLITREDPGSTFLADDLPQRGVHCVLHKLEDTAPPKAVASNALSTPIDVVVVGSQDYRLLPQILTQIKGAENKKHDARIVIIQQSLDFNRSKAPKNSVVVTGNPFLPEKIYRAIAVAGGRASPEIEMDAMDIMPALVPSLEEAQAQNALILIVEDNSNNQEVMRRQVNLFGYAACLANHGREALELMQTHSFALILTDCHMPVMDGFQFTQEVRRRESGFGRHIPIIAATANAMQGEAERCLATGMDDFISKPIELNKLKKVLHKWLPQSSTPTPPATSNTRQESAAEQNSEQQESPIDRAMLVKYLGDDEAFHQEYLASYLVRSREIMEELRGAFDAQDWKQVRQLAHTLKSSSRAAGATRFGECCQRAELAAKANQEEEIKAAFLDLIAEYGCVAHYLEELE